MQEAKSRQQRADSRQQTADSRQQTADSRQQTADSREQRAESRQQTADSREERAEGCMCGCLLHVFFLEFPQETEVTHVREIQKQVLRLLQECYKGV
jgi:hypothetical protein